VTPPSGGGGGGSLSPVYGSLYIILMNGAANIKIYSNGILLFTKNNMPSGSPYVLENLFAGHYMIVIEDVLTRKIIASRNVTVETQKTTPIIIDLKDGEIQQLYVFLLVIGIIIASTLVYMHYKKKRLVVRVRWTKR
jgi:hypothetical protein